MSGRVVAGCTIEPTVGPGWVRLRSPMLGESWTELKVRCGDHVVTVLLGADELSALIGGARLALREQVAVDAENHLAPLVESILRAKDAPR